MIRLPLLALLIAALPVAAQARDSLGVFESWGAFRDPSVPRCYAIAEPVRKHRDGAWRAYASIGSWPRQGVRGQIHFRLSRARTPDAPKTLNNKVTLSIGDQRFALVAGAADAWAADRRADAAIVAAIRSGTSMSVQGRASNGRPFVDVYALRGAATAIDAAALGCARSR
ncbi:MAG TPA: hypothetical protein VF509_13450 [Sphingobium sp.]